jgi:DNA-binding response OmpR family regulator
VLILIVDDNVDAAWSLASVLKLAGHEVETAHDGFAALEMVATRRPRLAFIDIGMPRMSGYELAYRLRALPEGHRIYIAALTGHGSEKDLVRAQSAGIDQHFTKPAQISELLECVKAVARDPSG